jgi:Na+-transporting NADH:ubiquinone oxidoreductase subunit B
VGQLLHGAAYFLPIYLTTFIVGGFWEVLFASIRKHEVNEGFFVTSVLFALTCRPTSRCGRWRWASASAW